MEDETIKAMAFSPIPITLSGSFGNNSTMRMYKVTVNDYTFSVDGNDGNSELVIDISSAVRGTLMENFDITDESPNVSAEWSVTVMIEYMQPDGLIKTESGNADPSSGIAYLGRMTERERKAKICPDEVAGTTTLPSGRVTLDNMNPSSATYTKADNGLDYVKDSDGKKYYGFRILNHYGGIDHVFAHSMSRESIGTSVESFSRLENSDYSISGSMISVPKKGYRTFEMSSGACSRQWAEWWANEFLHARAVAVHMDGGWVQCIVKPKSDTTLIVDESKADALHVDFTVTLAVDG